MDSGSSLGDVYRMRALLREEQLSRFKLECEIAAMKIRRATDNIPGLVRGMLLGNILKNLFFFLGGSRRIPRIKERD